MNLELINSLDKLPGWLSIHEGQFLHKAATNVKDLKGEMVEIGSFQGKSTIYLAKSGQCIYAVDPHEGKLDHGTTIPPTLVAFKKHVKDFKVERQVTLIKKTSSSAVKGWNKKLKLLFIDGLHDKKNAEFDYKKWSPFLVDGGMIAMHDSFCGWRGAQSVALEKIVLNDEYFEVGVVGSIIYGIRGKGTLISILNRLRIRFLVHIAFWFHSNKKIPSGLSFFMIHRFLKLLLLNQYTLKRA